MREQQGNLVVSCSLRHEIVHNKSGKLGGPLTAATGLSVHPYRPTAPTNYNNKHTVTHLQFHKRWVQPNWLAYLCLSPSVGVNGVNNEGLLESARHLLPSTLTMWECFIYTCNGKPVHIQVRMRATDHQANEPFADQRMEGPSNRMVCAADQRIDHHKQKTHNLKKPLPKDFCLINIHHISNPDFHLLLTCKTFQNWWFLSLSLSSSLSSSSWSLTNILRWMMVKHFGFAVTIWISTQ